jgi:hypothetical protein
MKRKRTENGSPRNPVPVGLKPPHARPPTRLRSTADLGSFQRLMAHLLVRPLAPGDTLQPFWIDGRTTAEVASQFIKSSDRLAAVERLQIYSRMYWFRLMECVCDDNPGLRALLGERKFDRLARAYLAKNPSRSFTLRNLCSRLQGFVAEEPGLTAPHAALASDVAQFEWAQTVAFDGESRPVLEPGEFGRTDPARLRLGLQPYLSLLALDHPVDDFVIAVKKRSAWRAEASNAIGRAARTRRPKQVRPPRPGKVYLAVHRHSGRLYYKRLELPAFRILSALREGRTLTQAIAGCGRRVRPDDVQAWFATWTKLGWLCRWRRIRTPSTSLA